MVMTPLQSMGESKRTNKSCDACRSRKVRCPNPQGSEPCNNCVKRKIKCHYEERRPARRQNVAEQFIPRESPPIKTISEVDQSTLPSLPAPRLYAEKEEGAGPQAQEQGIPKLYVDQLLDQASSSTSSRPLEKSLIRGNGIIGSFRITFFSEARLASLSSRLGNNKINQLIHRVSNVILDRVNKVHDPGNGAIVLGSRREPILDVTIRPADARKYIETFFTRIHPIFPFLDRLRFERKAYDLDEEPAKAKGKPWDCLYYTVLALGCQLHDGGSFEPGLGLSWKLFSVALSSFSDLVLEPNTLPTLQAMAAMSVYSLGVCCISLEHTIIAEAARRAQGLASSHFSAAAAPAYQRTFWAVYSIEKLSSFHMGRNSVFIDNDISCPIPRVNEPVAEGFDWFLTLSRYSRIVSKAMSSLFCIGVVGKPASYYLRASAQLRKELEAWRLSIPDNGLRPGGDKYSDNNLETAAQRNLAVIICYLHANLLLIISLANLHHLPKSSDANCQSQRQRAVFAIRKAARDILGMTPRVEVEPYTNMWVLAIIPVQALFVLFDMIIHNPSQPEATSDLTLLDMAAGHFSRIEYCSRGTLPGSLVSEFAHIARTYVYSIQQRNSTRQGAPQQQESTGWGLIPAQPSSLPLNDAGNNMEPDHLTVQNQKTTEVLGKQQQQQDPALEFDWVSDGLEWQMTDDTMMGTNIMDLFNTYLPGLDPMFYPGA